MNWVILAPQVSENAACTYVSKGAFMPKLETLLSSMGGLMYINVRFMWGCCELKPEALCRATRVFRLSYTVTCQREHRD